MNMLKKRDSAVKWGFREICKPPEPRAVNVWRVCD